MACQCNNRSNGTSGYPAASFGPLVSAANVATEVFEDEGSASPEEREWISEGVLESNRAEMQSALNSGGPMSFSPVSVERPGGGRIQDKRVPRAADLVIVKGVGKRVSLHRIAASAWQALVGAARADGIREPLLLPVSGFRDPARQRQLWQAALQRYGSPQEARKWVAPPGSSAHQSGRAIDFYLGGRNSSANVTQLRTLPAYRWLLTNAVRFGFYPYAAEPWHWEYNPPAQTANEFLEFQPQMEFPGYESSGELEFETPRARRRSGGTQCGTPGAAAALISQPGGRCVGPRAPMCPPMTGVLSVQAVSNIPFEYVDAVGRNPATNLIAVTRRQRPRTQRFIPSVQTALTEFIANMARFGMPIEALLTAGSFCCRCISRTNRLSNHSYADAFDLVGVRWADGSGRETIVHNWDNSGERALLRRINACLRLSFATVIDYHRSDHRDHFHCDTNRGAGQRPRSPESLRFTQEALGLVLGRAIPITGSFDAATQQAFLQLPGVTRQTLRSNAQLNQILTQLFTGIAAGTTATSAVTHETAVARRSPRRPPLPEPPGLSIYERIVLGGEAGAQPMTGIFVPSGYRPQAAVDLIIYFHGMKAPSGMPLSATVRDYWSRRYPFQLREGLNESGKNAILVVPTLGPASEAGKLTRTGGFDWYLEQILRALQQRGVLPAGQRAEIGNIVLACHSAGGKVLRALALMNHQSSPKIRECWGFDCLYGGLDAKVWRQWASANPNARLFVYYLWSTEKQSRALAGQGRPPIAPPPNVTVQRSSAANHNLVPVTHWTNRTRSANFLANR